MTMLPRAVAPMRSSTPRSVGDVWGRARLLPAHPSLIEREEGSMNQEHKWVYWPALDDARVYDDTDLLALIIEG